MKLLRRDDQDVFYLHRKEVLYSGTQQTCRLQMLKTDGEKFWARIDGITAKDKVIAETEIRFVVSDIGENRLMEENLRKSEQLYHSLVETSQDLIWQCDTEGRYIYLNQAWEKVFGYELDEMLGKKFSDFQSAESAAFGQIEHCRLMDGNLLNNFEATHIGKSGKEIHLVFNARFVSNEHREIIGTSGTAYDITERQHSHEIVKFANNKMSQLLRTIAHEFRTPLGLLTGSTDILDRYWDRLTSKKRLEQNDHIRDATRQLINLVNSVISFNQSGTDTSGMTNLMDVAKVCRDIFKDVQTVWGTGQHIETTIAECGTATLNETLFRRILENLLTNAFRFTPSVGTVSLDVYREKNLLKLEISDTGIGISDNDQKFVFDSFYRGGNVEGRRGLGLGLSIVQEALTELKGTILIASRLGAGTVVTVKMPL